MPTASANALPERTLQVIAASSALALVLLLVTPRAAPGTLALLALAIGLAAGGALAWPSWRSWGAPAFLVLALGTWAAISTLWAADPKEAVGKSAMLLAFSAVVCWSQFMLDRSRPELLRHACRAGLIAFGAGLVYLCFEEISGHLLKRGLFIALPFTRPDDKHISDSPHELLVSSYISNRSMSAVVLALWPMLLIAHALVDRARRLPAVAALLMLAVTTLALSKHETSIIALAASAAVFALCLAVPRVGLGFIAAGWVFATLLVVPAATWALRGAELHKAEWLPNSARHRIVLWAYTAGQVQHRPLHGIGAASTKLVDASRGAKVDPLPGTHYQWRSSPHPHNVYLQIWYELGAVGALLLCAGGLALIWSFSRLPPAALPFAAATMTAAAISGAFSWGLWQAWFLAAFSVGALLTATANHVARQDGRANADAVVGRC